MIALLSLLTQTAAAAEPDLRFVDINATYVETTDTLYLAVEVENVGSAAAGFFWVDAWSASDWAVCADQEWSSDNLGGLNPGDSQWFTFVVDDASVSESDIYIYVDIDDNVLESNEKNNGGVVFAMPENPDEDRIGVFQLDYAQPACLVNALDGFGWDMIHSPEMLYAKARVL